ncbi:MAG: choice-of-anchor D domain-containing protein, partial [Terriglobia bacterium]
SIVSNASDSRAVISLSGTGTSATLQLSVSPSSIIFGNVTRGSSSTLPAVVTNTGGASVTISQATTTGAGFSLSGPTLPLNLAAGQDTSFSVTFDPAASGSVTGALSIIGNATNSPNVESLSASGVNPHSVNLTWVASTSPNITGYDVYRGTVSGGPYAEISSSAAPGTTFTDATVQAGETYYYVTAAVNSQGVESSDSNQAAAVVPSP